MEPTLRAGDSALVDHSRRELYNGIIFALNIEGGPIVKRVRRLQGAGWRKATTPPMGRSTSGRLIRSSAEWSGGRTRSGGNEGRCFVLLFRLVGFAALVSLLIIAPGQAPAQSSIEKTDQTDCKIEDWRWTYNEIMGSLRVEGAVTCNTGRVIIRAYTEKEEEVVYLGNMDSLIDGYAFTAIMMAVEEKPESLSIRYTIGDEY